MSVRWARGDQDDDIWTRDKWEFPNDQVRHNDAVIDKLEAAAQTFCEDHGPFDIERNEITDPDEFAEIYNNILSKESYAVKLYFQNGKTYFEKRTWANSVEKQTRNIDAGCDDAYEAALLYVIRPTVTVSCWQWGYYDENGKAVKDGSTTREVDLKSLTCVYKEEYTNTESSIGTDIVWKKSEREKDLLEQFRALEGFDPQANFEAYIAEAQKLVKSKKVKRG